MTPRERFVRTHQFGEKPDRVFYDFAGPRRSTLEAWKLQGLPDFPPAGDYACPLEFKDWVGMDRYADWAVPAFGMRPGFEERTIKEESGHRIWVDSRGITMEDAGKNLNTPGFRTRSYLEHPVKNRQDWFKIKDRFDPDRPRRFPLNWAKQAGELKNNELPLYVCAHGLYNNARDLLGFETLSVMFYDDPSLVHEIMDQTGHLIFTVLEGLLADVQLDCFEMSEDMAYKGSMMISPAMFREFMMPCYKRIAALLDKHNVPIKSVDSDGYVGELIPLLIEAGFNRVEPMEIAAGNDPVAFRKKYGKDIAFKGGIDKRELTTKERTYKEVMSKVPWLLEQGGYLPGVDHGVPPTVTLRGYLYMCELIKAISEGRSIPQSSETLEIEKELGPLQRLWSVEFNAIHPDD